jgi:hypothetical protein
MRKFTFGRSVVAYVVLFVLLLVLASAKTAVSVSGKSASTAAAAGAGTFNLRDYGAVGDGAADDGPALQRALDALAEAGGGSLVVPAGRYAVRTPVAKDFTGLADSVEVLGVESSTRVDTNFTPDVLTRGLNLTSEIYPMTGPSEVTLSISGLRNFTVRDIAFVGTPDVPNDAKITLDIDRVEQATVLHCEFYGLRAETEGGAIISARRSRLKVEQTMFLGTFGYSALYVPVIQNLEWKDIYVTTTIFADYGQRPGFHGKTQGATFSWVNVGNPAPTDSNSPRREVVVRDVIMDEGAYFGLFSHPARYESSSPPIDLIYITDLFQNVSNLGSAGILIHDARGVLIENSHHGYSRYTAGAIILENVGTAIIDRVECVDSADIIRADSTTGKLYVINSIYKEVISQAQSTRLIQNVADEDDPVWYVRQQFQEKLGRAPEPSEHFYWSDRLLACVENAPCVAAARSALATHLAAAPPATFNLNGKVTGEDGKALADVMIALSGSQAIVTRTNEQGEYRFANLPTSGSYMIVASKNHYLIGSPSRTVIAPTGDRVENFTAALKKYAISGWVINENNYNFPGVTVTLSGARSATTVTDAQGYFSFEGLDALGNYTVTPSLTYYSFNQPAHSINSLTDNQSLIFYGRLNRHAISGRLADGNNKGLGGASVVLAGAQSATATTDGAGNYSFGDLPASGNYTVTPALAGYTFGPAAQVFNNLSADETANFAVLYSIRGRVSGVANEAMSGVSVTLTGTRSAATTTDAAGNYSFTGIAAGGSYTVAPALTNYVFSPVSLAFNNLSAHATANFTATLKTYTLSGQIRDAANSALGGAIVTLSGAKSATTTTDAAGNYSFAGLPAGASYAITPTLTNYTFAPPTATFNNLSGNQAANFTGTLNRHVVGGRVATGGASGLQGVVVTLGGAQAANAVTDAAGNYSFTNLAAGGSYTITLSKPGYSFTPSSRTIASLSGDRVENFTATLEKYAIGGRVVNENNYNFPGVTVTLSGARSATTVTDAQGYFSFEGLDALGNYTVTPSLTYYSFNQPAHNVNALTDNQSLIFYGRLNRHAISGRLADGNNKGLGGASVVLAGTQSATTTTDGAGNYSFGDLPASGNYTVTPALAHYTFTPLTLSFNNLSGNQTGNFAATRNTHALDGQIRDGSNAPLAGVTVTLSGAQSATTTTDAAGRYSFAGLTAGANYTVTPSRANYTFAPASLSFNNLSGNQAGNFSGTLNSYKISGRVGDASNNALAGVTLTLGGAQATTTTSDASGHYSFNLPAGGNYTVTPSRANYTFAPASLSFNNLSGDQAGNFAATLNTYTLGGRVTDGANNPLSGVTIAVSGAQSKVATTDAGGNYLIAGLNGGGNYTVTPSRANYTFAPASRSFNNLSASETGNFAATLNTHTIGGRVTDGANNALSGVSVTLGGTQNATTTTDAGGNYSFAGLAAGGNYTVTPSLTNYSFNPAGASLTNLSADQAVNFTASLNSYAINGRLTDGGGHALANAALNLTGARTASVVTDADGNYSFPNLPAGGNYTVTPSLAHYTFAPASLSFNNLSGNQAGNFSGTLNSYKISGRIAEGANILSGVTVALSGAQSATTTTDAAGNYSFNLAAGGSYVVTPSLANYTFAPASLSFNNLSGNQTGNFAATRNTHALDGQIRDGSNAPLAGVTVTLSGAQSATTTTDAAGRYSFAGLTAGANYTVTPSRANYTFAPASLSFNNLSGDQAGNFSGTLNSYKISGRVGDASNNALAGVTLTLGGAQATTTTTSDASGNYSFNLPAGGNYTVTPSRAHYTFAPASLSFNNLSGDQAGNFAATLNTHTIGGRVTDGTNNPLSGVSVTLGGTQNATTTTDAGGNYSFAGLAAGGNYTVTPAKQNYTFSPRSLSFTNFGGDHARADFAGAAAPKTVQFNQASYQASEGSTRATFVVTRTGDTSEAATVEYKFGESAGGVPCFTFDGTANARCDFHSSTNVVVFAPGEDTKEIGIQLIDDGHVEGAETLSLRLVGATGAALGAQSTATLLIQDNDTTAAQNPIFNTPFFVRMQYLDFLAREPEAGEPWSAVLNNCSDVNNNPACDRNAVSQSFFGSPEFRLKGFYAFNFYRVAFDRRPAYEEIIRDMTSITGATADETYRKRAAFPVNFTGGAEFKERYGALSDADFVNALLDRYNLQQVRTADPSNPESGAKVLLTRAGLINRLAAGGEQSLTRAQVLRAVVESDEVAAAEYNRAFVAMQYYGYLRRSPEEEGYQAWLKVITQDPSNVRRMVDGFMNSIEYQLRFGPAKAMGGGN